MTVYLIHFERPFKHAVHYLGFTEGVHTLLERMERHRSGAGANILRHVTAAGINWQLVRVWSDGDRTLERRLKKHSSTRLCPACNPSGWHKREPR